MLAMDDTYFQTYFSHISSVGCDKAREHVEKWKNAEPVALQSALVQFALCEKSYYSLVFMEQKWFGRKDPLKNAYLALSNELQNFAKVFRKDDLCNGMLRLCATVAGHLSCFCLCRVECIELYESSIRSMSLAEMEKAITTLITNSESIRNSNTIKPIADSFMSEFLTFQKLIRTSLLISEWNFFDCLIELHKIHQTLTVWQPLLLKEQHHTYSFRPGLLGFGERRSSSPISAIYQWMGRYFQELVYKFSFYFYKLLGKMDFSDEIKATSSKTGFDYVSKIVNFCKKLDSCYVILCATSNENTMKLVDDTNKMTHARVLELPTVVPEYLKSSLDNFLYNKSEDIAIEKIMHCYDKHIKFSFYAVQTDPGMIFVVAAVGKRSERDSFISNFITETVTRLQPKRIFLTLKPGVK